jgi:hypothetical protein
MARHSIVVAFAVFASGFGLQGQELTSERHAAVAAWNRMVAAKGGRERLHTVKTFRVVERETPSVFDTRPHLVDRHTETVVDMPDRLWEWRDSRPNAKPPNTPEYGFGARILNTSECLGWTSSNGGLARFVRAQQCEYGARTVISELILVYLLESADFQPTPLRVSQAGRNRVALEVEARGFNRVTYLVDTKTNLPVQLVVEHLIQRTWDGSNDIVKSDWPRVYRLGSYRAASGVMVPTQVGRKRVTFEVNPSLDARLFTTLPDGVSDATAWRTPVPPENSRTIRTIGTIENHFGDFAIDLPPGAWATVAGQAGFNVQMTWSSSAVLRVSAAPLPEGNKVSRTADTWLADMIASNPNLAITARTPATLAGLEAVELTLADPSRSGDVNFSRAIIAHRSESGLRFVYTIALSQWITSVEGDDLFRTVVGSFRFLRERALVGLRRPLGLTVR